jgi:predicted RNA-binding Zn-ribbon protein involved in translation (DUF1610 family)
MKRRANKQHVCTDCDGVIEKGEKYNVHEFKAPRCEDEEQVGIKFFRFKICAECEDKSKAESDNQI